MPPTPQSDVRLIEELARSAKEDLGHLAQRVDRLSEEVAALKLAAAKGSAVSEFVGKVPMWAALVVSVAGALRSFGVL